jgi:hypothetical protein
MQSMLDVLRDGSSVVLNASINSNGYSLYIASEPGSIIVEPPAPDRD